MDEFISLTCPNCRGTLEITIGRNRFICQYCGSEHFLRRKNNKISIEEINPCPICHKNDQISKLSLILKDNTLSSSSKERFSRPKKPIKPSRPENYNRLSTFDWIFLSSYVIFELILFISLRAVNFYCKYPALIIISIIFSLVVIRNAKKKRENDNNNFLEAQKKFHDDMINFDKQLELWSFLYYCTRDDIIFNSHHNEIIEPENLTKYLQNKTIEIM